MKIGTLLVDLARSVLEPALSRACSDLAWRFGLRVEGEAGWFGLRVEGETQVGGIPVREQA
jgi:hypothetical protein